MPSPPSAAAASAAAVCRVAVVQAPPVFLDLTASLERAVEFVDHAAREGARLVVFPETWLPGYPVWLDESPGAALWDSAPARSLFRLLFENALAGPDDPRLGPLRALVGRTPELHVVLGAHERRGGTLYNSMLLLRAGGDSEFGESLILHRKLMPTYAERLLWGRGDGSTLRTIDTPWGPLGGLICWEHWMPLARQTMHDRGEAIHIAQWPAVKEMHLVASRHYAFEGRCFVVAAGCALRRADVVAGMRGVADADDPAWELIRAIPGDDATLLQAGGSAVVAPDGRLLAGPLAPTPSSAAKSATGIVKPDNLTILLADLDLREVTEGRLALDAAGHYARPDIFRLRVDTRPQPLVDYGPLDAGDD